MSDIKNPLTVQRALETEASPISFHEQLHGTLAHVIEKNGPHELRGDILITQQANTPLVIRVADCASILLFDPTKKIIANIHAGWRGLAAGGIPKTIQKLQAEFGVEPKNIFAGISPMLGPCCSRFSDPKNELPESLHRYITEKNHVDLWAMAEEQLRECGVAESQIENPRVCTFCNPEEFFSYRREPGAGRFGTAIMLL